MGGAGAIVNTNVTPGHFQVAGKEFPNVKWWKLSNLRSTYFLLFFVILTSVSRPTIDCLMIFD
jgi:hypothetical protein